MGTNLEMYLTDNARATIAEAVNSYGASVGTPSGTLKHIRKEMASDSRDAHLSEEDVCFTMLSLDRAIAHDPNRVAFLSTVSGELMGAYNQVRPDKP